MEKELRSKTQFPTEDAIWNAVLDFASTVEFPTGDSFIDELVILVCAFNELESGGHEALLNWNIDIITKIGIERYVQALTNQLQEVGAHSLASTEQQYALKYWKLYNMLERGEIEEEAFYEVIEHVDTVYYSYSEQLHDLMQQYFNQIYTKLFKISD